MSKKEKYPENVFVSLPHLLRQEHAVQDFTLLSRKHKVNSMLSGKHVSKLRGRGLDFEEVRNYVKGDDIRNIDWKVTARTQKTHTRVYTEEKEKPVLIVVDQSKSMFFGSVLKTKAVVAAELAAIAAFSVFREGDRVGGVVFTDEGFDVVAPKRSRKNIICFLESVEKRNRDLKNIKLEAYEETLNTVIPRVRNIVTHDYLVIIISDFLRYSPKVIKAIAGMSKHNDLLLVKVTDPMEYVVPKTKFVVSNQTHQIVVDGKNKEVKNAFMQGFENDFHVFQTEMKKYQIPILNIDTVNPLNLQLKEVFGKTNVKK